MNAFTHGPVTEIPTDSPTTFAFRITGHLDDEAAEAFARHMNQIFDRHEEKVDMLLDLSGFTGSDWDSMLDGDVLMSRLRALSEVRRYAVIGAPDGAARMIGMMDKVIPVEARAFKGNEREAARAFVGASQMSA